MSEELYQHPLNLAAIQRLRHEGGLPSSGICADGIYLIRLVIGGLPENDSRAEELAYHDRNESAQLLAMKMIAEEDCLSTEEILKLSYEELADTLGSIFN